MSIKLEEKKVKSNIHNQMAPIEKVTPSKEKLTKRQDKQVFTPIFIAVAIFMSLLCSVGFLYPAEFKDIANSINTFIAQTFGGYYLALVFICLLLCVGLGVSPFGKIRLGGKEW